MEKQFSRNSRDSKLQVIWTYDNFAYNELQEKDMGQLICVKGSRFAMRRNSTCLIIIQLKYIPPFCLLQLGSRNRIGSNVFNLTCYNFKNT